ncbi:MAG: hypothetical protein ACREJS_16800 [Candidatus Rokuibacteriota bacterium]
MTRRPAINPGRVDWSGENPGMYLKESADGPFTTLVSFFRVVMSPHGRGHALILLEAPGVNASLPEALNVCVTDNEPLARWLVQDFAASFGAFRGVPALRTMPYVPLSGVQASGDQRASYMEWVQGDGVEVTLSWEQLGQPFMVELAPERSPTGRHEMWSLFIEARRATATVNGRRLRGQPVPRDFQGRRSSTAFLAFSETWVRADSPR